MLPRLLHVIESNKFHLAKLIDYVTKVVNTFLAYQSLSQNNPCVQTDLTRKLHSVLPFAKGHLKKQLCSQTKLGASHLSSQPLYHCQLWLE